MIVRSVRLVAAVVGAGIAIWGLSNGQMAIAAVWGTVALLAFVFLVVPTDSLTHVGTARLIVVACLVACIALLIPILLRVVAGESSRGALAAIILISPVLLVLVYALYVDQRRRVHHRGLRGDDEPPPS